MPLVDHLLAAPSADPGLALFGRIVGDWALDWRSLRGDGATARGVLSAGWILGGRAVQDVWIVPGPGEPGSGTGERAFHGTTIRMLDTDGAHWRSTWLDPLHARVRRFRGAEEEGRVVLLSTDEDPWMRWSFHDVTADAFRWTGEWSDDGGSTWLGDDEMRATRIGGGRAS